MEMTREVNATEKSLPALPALVYAPHPISAAIKRQVIHASFLLGESIADYLERVGLVIHHPVALCLNDQRIDPDQWAHTYPQPGDLITLRGIVQGGGQGSDPVRTMLTLAVLMAAPTVGAWGGIMTSGAVAPWAGQALFAVGGMYAINAMVPPPDAPDFSDDTSPTYSLSGSANRARINQPLPLVCGTHRMYADHGANPYTDFQGDDQYLYQVFNFGLSDITLSDFKIGDTAYNSYDNVTIEESPGSTGVLTLFPANVDVVAGGDLDHAGTWVQRTTSINTVAIGLDISGLIFYSNSDGRLRPLRVTLNVEYRAVGSGTWLTLDTWVIENDDRTPVRAGKKHTVTSGQYEVRLRIASACFPTLQSIYDADGNIIGTQEVCSSISLDHSRVSAIVSWAALRSYQADAADYTGQKRVALSIKANGQLQGQVAEFNALASARCPVWNGSSWVTQATSNPAWWYLWFARGKFSVGGQRMFGAGLPDADIDIEAIKSWGAWCTAKGLTFDAVIDQKQSCFAVLQVIARCGRAAPTRASGKLGVIWDADSQPAVAVFGMSNIIRNSFSVRYLTGQLPDEVVVNFVNAANDYKPDTVRATVPGVVSPINPLTMDLFGCTNAVMAGREANLMAAQQSHRRRQIVWDADMEGMVCQRGDVAALSHDLTQWAKSGRLVAGTTTTLTLDREVTFTPATQHYILVRFPNGSFDVYAVTYQTGPSAIITLTDPLPSSPDADPNHPPHDYLWMFDVKTTPGKLVKITDIRPQSLYRATITATDEDPAYYLSEFNAYTYVPPGAGNARLPTISGVEVNDTLILAGNSFGVRVAVVWSVTGEYGSATIRAASHGQPLRDMGKTFGRRFEFDWTYITGDIDIEITLVNLSGQYGVNSRSTVVYTIKGKDNPPSDVLNFNIKQMGDAALARWDALPDVDLKGYSLRYGPRGNTTYANATPLTTVTSGTNVTTVALPPGDWTVFIKGVDTNRLESANPASCDLVFINTYDIIAQAQQAPNWLRQNWLNYSNKFNSWSATNSPGIVENGDGTWTISDVSALNWATIFQSVSGFDITATYSLSIDVLKDAVTSRFVMMQIQFGGSTSEIYKVFLNTATGVIIHGGNSVANDVDVENAGAFWRIGVKAKSVDQLNTLMYCVFVPAVGSSTLGVEEASATGSVTIRAATLVKSDIIIADHVQVEGTNRNTTGGISRNFIHHEVSGTLVPKSTAINANIGWRTFNEFVPDPTSLCIYIAPVIDIGFDDTVRVWGDIESALGFGETGIADPQLFVDYKLNAGQWDGFEPWSVGNVTARMVQHKLELDITQGVAYISGFKPTVDLLEWTQRLDNIVVAPGGSVVNFPIPFHVAPFPESPSMVSGTGLFPLITNITTTQFTINVYNSSNVSVGGTARAAFTGV